MAFYSIRTRYAISTALILLALLALFYVCGRTVLADLLHNVEMELGGMGGSMATMAICKLTFFVAVAGMLVILPIFWIQGWLLLNPLTRMTKAMRSLAGAAIKPTEAPLLEWKGKDEFAILAASVNQLLETVSERTVAIAQMEQQHKALIGALPDAVAVFDPQGRLVTVSKEADGVAPLPGFHPGEPPDQAVFGVDGAAMFAKALAETSATGRTRLVKLCAQSRHFEVRLTRLDGHFVLTIVRDVSAEVVEHRLRVEAERRALDNSKRESLTALAAGIAHDMNNVLSVMLQAAETEKGGDGHSEQISVIRDAVRRGAAMMRELSAFAGESKITLMRAHPKLVVEDIRQLSSLLVGENIDLTIGADDATPDVDVDPNQFWKVFFNIIKNASEAIGFRPGHIDLRAMPFTMTPHEALGFASEHPLGAGPGVMFRIRDDGPGIPPDLLKRILTRTCLRSPSVAGSVSPQSALSSMRTAAASG